MDSMDILQLTTRIPYDTKQLKFSFRTQEKIQGVEYWNLKNIQTYFRAKILFLSYHIC